MPAPLYAVGWGIGYGWSGVVPGVLQVTRTLGRMHSQPTRQLWIGFCVDAVTIGCFVHATYRTFIILTTVA